MTITADMMREQIKRLSIQRDNSLATFHQAVGAISLAEHILSQIESAGENAAMSMDKFAASMGADSAEIIPLNNATA